MQISILFSFRTSGVSDSKIGKFDMDENFDVETAAVVRATNDYQIKKARVGLLLLGLLLCVITPITPLYALKVCNIDSSDDRITHREDNLVACYTLHGISATVDV